MTNANFQSIPFSSGRFIFGGGQILSTPLCFDVRRAPAIEQAPETVPGALLAPDLCQINALNTLNVQEALGTARSLQVRVICVHGHERSLAAQTMVQRHGWNCQIHPGGLDAYCANGGVTMPIIDGVTGVLGQNRHWVVPDGPDGQIAARLVAALLDPLAQFTTAPDKHQGVMIDELNNHKIPAKPLLGSHPEAQFPDLHGLVSRLDLAARFPVQDIVKGMAVDSLFAALAASICLPSVGMTKIGAVV